MTTGIGRLSAARTMGRLVAAGVTGVVIVGVLAGRAAATAVPGAPPSPSPAAPSSTGPSPGPTGWRPPVWPPTWPPLPDMPSMPRVPGRPLLPHVPGLSGGDRGGVGGMVGPFLQGLLESAVREVGAAFVQAWLLTPQLADQPRIRDLWQTSLVLAVTAYVLLVLLGGVLVMTHESVQTRYAARQIAPRIIVGLIAAAVSLLVVGWAVAGANALTLGVLGPGVDVGRAVSTFVKMTLTPFLGGGWVLLFLQLVGLIMMVALIATFVIRLIVTIVLIVSAPLALACHASPLTEAVAFTWWRLLAAVLGIQVTQSLALITAVRVLGNSDGRQAAGLGAGGRVVNVLITLCLLYVMIKIPVWLLRMALHRTGHHQPLLVRIATYAAANRLIRLAGRGIRQPFGATAPASKRAGLAAGRGGRGKAGRFAAAAGALAAGAATGGVGAVAGAGVGAGGAAGGAGAGGAGAASAAGHGAGASAARPGLSGQGLRRAFLQGRIVRTPRAGGLPRWAPRRTRESLDDAQGQRQRPQDATSQPRWAHPDKRWAPPDPGQRRITGRPQRRPDRDPAGDSARRRWGAGPNPWAPPYAGPWRQPPRRPRPPRPGGLAGPPEPLRS